MKVPTTGLRWTAALGVLGCAAAYTWLPGTAQADVSTFNASAVAYPFQTATTNAGLPLGVPYGAYGPFASTILTSLGAADAVAAGPYPGAVAVQLPGLVNAITGVQLPDFPFYLQAQAGEGAKHVDNPLSSLSAASNIATVTADAVLGSGFSGASARARSERLEFGGVRASAESAYDILELTNNIEIRGLRSEASATSDSGKLTRTSLLEFGSITAPGLVYQTPCAPPPQSDLPGELPCYQSKALVLSFRDGQFLASTPDGTQQAAPVDASAVENAFKAIGVTMTYQKPAMTQDGIVGAGLTLAYDLPAIPENQSGIAGVTNHRIELGFASAAAKAVTSKTIFGPGTGPAAALSALGMLALAGVVRTRTNGE
jgi:hypothetical protein